MEQSHAGDRLVRADGVLLQASLVTFVLSSINHVEAIVDRSDD